MSRLNHNPQSIEPGGFGPLVSFRYGREYDTPVPLGVNEALVRYGGRNIYGEPRYRIVWSERRLEAVFGEWLDWSRDAVEKDPVTGERHANTPDRRVVEVRWVPKYEAAAKERFVLEEWQPAERYGTPETWAPELGPYPARGDYELLKVCEACPQDCTDSKACADLGHERQFFAPDPHWVRRWITGYLHFRDTTTKGQILAATRDFRKKREERAKMERREIIASGRSAFGMKPWVAVNGGRDGFVSAA